MLEGTEEGKVNEVKTALRSRPTTLAKAVDSYRIEGDEVVPTMVPSWWTDDADAFEQGQGAAAFFGSMPKGGD